MSGTDLDKDLESVLGLVLIYIFMSSGTDLDKDLESVLGLFGAGSDIDMFWPQVRGRRCGGLDGQPGRETAKRAFVRE